MGSAVTNSPAISTQLSPAKLAQITVRAADRPHEWLGLLKYDTSRRWYRRLALADDHELWLLSWLPGQGTGFHDHGESAGAFTVALGCLFERAAPGGRPAPSARALGKGAVRSFGPGYVHDVSNESVHPAVSLHAYSPPLASMRHYETTPGGLLGAGLEITTW
jgi:predicted metal-dependent enzyme (double-stranded beta helix superfamily)